jgi:pentapeptide repeat protein/TIR domain-containing protein
MEREEALTLLRGGRRGIETWNRFRHQRRPAPNLKKCDLVGAQLSGADLAGVNLRKANLERADLARAGLRGAQLEQACLARTRTCEADLRGVDFQDADLEGADLTHADLRAAVLERASLVELNLFGANLNGARLHGAVCQATNFTDVNLSAVEGLESVRHLGPSEVSTSTLRASWGRIPERFLAGCGFADWQILASRLFTSDLAPDVMADIRDRMIDLRVRHGIQAAPLFVCHDERDAAFAAVLATVLDRFALRCWSDSHAPDTGPSVRRINPIQRIMAFQPAVLLVLSEHSVGASWAAHLIQEGLELGRKLKRDVVYPVALDDAWKAYATKEPFRSLQAHAEVVDCIAWSDRTGLDACIRTLVDRAGWCVGRLEPASPDADADCPARTA